MILQRVLLPCLSVAKIFSPHISSSSQGHTFPLSQYLLLIDCTSFKLFLKPIGTVFFLTVSVLCLSYPFHFLISLSCLPTSMQEKSCAASLQGHTSLSKKVTNKWQHMKYILWLFPVNIIFAAFSRASAKYFSPT